MAEFTLNWQGQCIRVICPEEIAVDIEMLFGRLVVGGGTPARTVTVAKEGDRYSIDDETADTVSDLARSDLASFLMDVVIRALITDQSRGVALHAGAVARNGRVVLVAGASGSGKSSLICWLVENGFEYLTDEIVLLEPNDASVVGMPRAVVVKPGSAELIREMQAFRDARTALGGTHVMIEPPASSASNGPMPVALIIFPEFSLGEGLSLAGPSAAECGLKLVECNLNARNFRDGGFAALTKLARKAPALSLRYGGFDQLEGTLDTLVGLAVDGTLDGERMRRFLMGLARPSGAPTKTTPSLPVPSAVPAPTPIRADRKSLTIGMATYDDYDGVYFTLQALRMYHGDALEDVEILIIDNNPTGRCATHLKALESASTDYRYLPSSERTGTMVRQKIVDEGRGEFILVMDCHVLLWPGALAKLRRYFADNPQSCDLLQGPLVYDDMKKLASHFRTDWRQGMFGTWDLDSRAEDIDAPPFEIPMQGLGVYAFRRAAWPGFNPQFRGFGGEEWYIHEKFRRAGGRALCLPFLRWLHRFQRPMGVPYVNKWDDRIRNYLIGFRELGVSVQPIKEHFGQILGANVAEPLIEAMVRELDAQRDAVFDEPVSISAPSPISNDKAS
ncbi:MAG: glycosyltransferase [Hyphomicrobiaceae bacterium]|nr:glycosyltransferase [Hyphomicrobiaceae bacterium]